MAKISGFSQYECDRCRKAKFFSDTDADAQHWRTIKRVDMMGVKTTRLLCPECLEKYSEIVEQQDLEFRKFIEYKKPPSSKEKDKEV